MKPFSYSNGFKVLTVLGTNKYVSFPNIKLPLVFPNMKNLK